MARIPVFISWSGEKSRQAAELLRDWLQDVLQNSAPWVSSKDIEKGQQWLGELNRALANGMGLLVLTKENKDRPWVLFEAGAIWKARPENRCCPVLVDLTPAELTNPLGLFQAARVTNREDMLALAKSVNNTADEKEALDDIRLDRAFSRVWEEFCATMGTIAAATDSVVARPQKPEERMIGEILQGIRRIEAVVYKKPPVTKSRLAASRQFTDQLLSVGVSREAIIEYKRLGGKPFVAEHHDRLKQLFDDASDRVATGRDRRDQ